MSWWLPPPHWYQRCIDAPMAPPATSMRKLTSAGRPATTVRSSARRYFCSVGRSRSTP
jgi:hypothetical protein